MTSTQVDSSYWGSAEEQALYESTAAFTRAKVLPNAQQWEDDGRLPRELHKEAAQLGLLGISFAEDVGGSGGGPREAVTVNEALHATGAPGGVYASLFTCGIALPHLAKWGTKQQIDDYVRPTLSGEKIGSLAITEPGGGSDVGHLRTSARRVGDDYLINGAKTYITSAVRADFYVVAVRTGDSERPGAAGVSLVVVDRDTPGLTVNGPLKKLGWHCSDTGELNFENVRVPVSNVVGEEHSGFEKIAYGFVPERLALAVAGYSHAQRCLDLTVEWCRNRETFGQALIKRQGVQNTLSEMARRIDITRTYCRHVADLYVAGHDAIAEVCFAKNTAVDTAEWVAHQAVQLHGGLGYMGESEVSRHYRDVRLLGIGGGTTEILTTLAAKRLGMTS